MDEPIGNHTTPADEDPLIHRYLGGLPAYAPSSRHFDDRVLSAVRRPPPEWVRQLGEKRRDIIASGLHRKALAFVALGGLVPTTALVVLAVIFRAEIAGGVGWLLGAGIPFAWERVTAEVSTAASAIGSVIPEGLRSPRGVAVLAAVLAGCAFGLTRTMKAKKAVTP